MKKRSILVLGTTILLGAATVAFAQETAAAGAGRVEVGLTPAGGTFFNTGTHTGADFGTYALGGDMTFNVNKYVGIEGEVGAGLGVAQTINYHDVSFQNLKSPNTIAYNVDLALYPGGNDRALVPYLTAGGGGMSLFSRSALNALDLTSTETFGSENVGGGIKWWSANNWGIRGDYRFIVVNGRSSVDPFFGLNETRYGNRITGSFMYTFNKY